MLDARNAYKTLLESELKAWPKSKKLTTVLSMLNIHCFNSNQLKWEKSFELGKVCLTQNIA